MYFSILCSLGFLFTSLYSVAHEMSSLTCCWKPEHNFWKILDLLSTRKTWEMHKCNFSVANGLLITIIIVVHATKEKLGISRESYFDCPRDQTSLEKILRMSSYIRSSDFKGLQTHALICFHVTLCFLFRHIEEKNIDTVNAGIDVFHFRMIFLLTWIQYAFPYMKSNQHLKMQNIKNAILSFVNLLIFYQHNISPEKKKELLLF